MAASSRLFEKGRIGTLETRNRIVMPAMASISAAKEGYATDLTRAYYEARARGGCGLIVVGSVCVDYPIGASGKPRLSVHTDDFIPSLRSLADVIHKHGAKAAGQITHAGNCHLQNLSGLQPLAPSAVLRTTTYRRPVYFMPRAITEAEIAEIVEKFAAAALRCQKAGMDGVEIHAGHGYLLSEFLSPFWNRRHDGYGGSFQNRARFLLEVISAIRQKVGADYPVWCRINGREPDVEGGTTLELSRQLAPELENAGMNAISVSVSTGTDVACPPGYILKEAAAIKKTVNIPVIAVGRINCSLAEKVLAEKKADFVAMARALVADPELPGKAAAGRFGDIRPCQYCNSCLNATIELQAKEGLRECAVNAALTREQEYEIKPAPKKKRVLVVGAGPGGMEAARVATLRGHEVTLYEKEEAPGGQLLMARLFRKEPGELITYFTGQLSKLGVKIETGKTVDAALIAQIKPDAVVISTGAVPAVPEIPGIERPNVISGLDIKRILLGDGSSRSGHNIKHTRLLRFGFNLMRSPRGRSLAERVAKVWLPLGKRIVVVGRGLPGIELAHFLVERGKLVTIVDTREDPPFGEPPMAPLRQYMEFRLIEKGVSMLTVTGYRSVNDRGLSVINKKGQTQTVEGDTIFFAADYRPDAELADALSGASYEVHRIGDCVKPCGILEAIRDGARIGHTL